MYEKITAVGTPTPWEGQHGTMYEALISFETANSGRVNMKTEDRWKVGDEVEITSRQENPKYGDKLQIQKPQEAFTSGNSPAGSKFDPEIQYKIDSSWAITSAINLLGDSAKVNAKEGGLLSTAKFLLTIRKQLITELKLEES